MKLISARQAWRDAYHEPRESVLASAAEKAKLGKEGRVPGETRPSRQSTTGRAAHMTAAGKVQHAISTLPKPLQHLGHVLYSPMANGNDLSIAHGLVWIGAGLGGLSEPRQERAYWMAMAAIHSHRRAVNQLAPLGPGEVCLFVEERLGAKVDPSHWARDWAAVWNQLAVRVDRLDAQALVPVAAVVAREQGRQRGIGWRWQQTDRDVVAERRAERYAERREQIVGRMLARLQVMSEMQITAWLARMQRYGKAYRAEWGEDIIEQPEVHQRYQDRRDAYWSVRQRLKRVA
jgi:hypothetical protein